MDVALVDAEELRTLFLSGLPSDVTERELYLLCRPCSGYEGCSLNPSAGSSGMVAFLVFSSNVRIWT